MIAQHNSTLQFTKVYPPLVWPADTKLNSWHHCATLVMFVHPQCPCTQASITELAILMAHCQDRLRAYVVFLRPSGADLDWEKTRSWYRAAQIPGVKVVTDCGAREIERFHATTSGEVFLYGSNSALLFTGGLTTASGHEGDSAGLLSIEAIVNEGRTPMTTAPTFGCLLHD